MKWWLTLYLLAQAADMATTAVKLHQGCHEAVWPNAPTLYAGKSAGVGVTFVLQRHHPTAGKVIAGIGIVSGSYGTIHNLQTACR